jgi:hypothetical protein
MNIKLYFQIFQIIFLLKFIRGNIECNKRLNTILNIHNVNQLEFTAQAGILFASAQGNITVIDYLKACSIRFVILNYTISETKQVGIYRQSIDEIKDITVFNILFKNVRPISTYLFKLGYIETANDTNERVVFPAGDSILGQVSTCFGQPEPPQNIRKISNNDGSVLLTWDPPLITRSPEICFYSIRHTYVDKSEHLLESKYFSYVIDQSEIDKIVSISITAVNHAKCYEKLNPNNTCNWKLNSKEVIIINTNNNQTTSAPTTTTALSSIITTNTTSTSTASTTTTTKVKSNASLSLSKPKKSIFIFYFLFILVNYFN